MACNCSAGRKAAATSQPSRIVYTLTEPNGHRRSYATQSEAEAAQKRLGGTIATSR